MTSIISLNKNFKTMFKWALKRNTSIMIIYSVLLCLAIFFNIYLKSIDTIHSGDTYFNVSMALSLITAYGLLAALFVYFSALKTFSFLHNKRIVDMFGAMPTKKSTIFVSHLLAGIATTTLPFIVASVITIALNQPFTNDGNIFNLCLYIILTTILMIIASYTFTALISYCCGTTSDAAISTLGINGIWIGIVILCMIIISNVIPGKTFDMSIPLVMFFSPYSFAVSDLCYYMTGNTLSITISIIWQILFTVGIFFLTLLVVKKRKAEVSQNGFAFGWFPLVIEAGLSVVCGGFIGYIAAYSANSGYNNMLVFVLWYLIIGLATFFILHLIFTRGRKRKLLRALIVFGSTSAAVTVLLYSVSFGLGIDTYVPNPNTLTYANFDGIDYKEPENIKTVTEIQKTITNNLHDKYSYPYYIGNTINDSEFRNDYYFYNEEDASKYPYYIGNTINDSEFRNDYYFYNEEDASKYPYIFSCGGYFNYISNYGLPITRYYRDFGYLADSETNNLLQKLYSSEEYKKNYYSNIWDENARKNITEQSVNISYESYNEREQSYETIGLAGPPSNKSLDDFLDGLYDVYIEDVKADKSFIVTDTGDAHSIIGNEYIYISIYYTKKKENTNPNWNNFYYDDRGNIEWLIVKSSYKNTIEYLSKSGISKATMRPVD